MIPLKQIQIAKPCQQSWDEMDGDETARFCPLCSRHVYNLSAMTADEAKTLVFETEGQHCVRFYRRKDGTIMTSDCPVGVRIAQRRFGAPRSWAVAMVIASVTGTSVFAAQVLLRAGVSVGKVAIQTPAPAVSPGISVNSAKPTTKSISTMKPVLLPRKP
jgi:hypothetical protein